MLAKKTKKSLKNAAKTTGVGEGTISGWKIHAPTLDNLVKIAGFYDVSLDYLVFGDKPTVPGLSPEGLKIARFYDDLPPEGKKHLNLTVETLEKEYPFVGSGSTNTAN